MNEGSDQACCLTLTIKRSILFAYLFFFSLMCYSPSHHFALLRYSALSLPARKKLKWLTRYSFATKWRSFSKKYCFQKILQSFWNLTSSSSLSPSLSSASDDAILLKPNAADDADLNNFNCYCTFYFIRPRKPPVHNQNI